MKAIFVVVAMACSSLHAQVLETPKSAPAAEQKNAIKQDRARPVEGGHHRHQRARPPVERETSAGTVKLDRARSLESRRPSSPRSPAEQQQREQYRKRQQNQP